MFFFILAAAMIWGMYKLIHMQNAIGNIFRLSWNILMGVWSFIPGFGFMSNFIVTDDEESKQKFVDMGTQADLEYQNQMNRKKAEEEARKAEEEARIAESQDNVRRNAWKNDGRTDVQFNRDSSKWKYSDESWDESHNV